MPLKQDHLNQGQKSSPTTKRQRLESPTEFVNSLIPLDTKKCGEVFVTNNADKWTFVCTFCKLTTGDIGVFICHIKVEHLHGDDQQITDSENISTSNNTASNVSNPNITNNIQKQRQNKFPAILEVTSLAGQRREGSTGEQLLALSSNNSTEESILPHNTEDQSEQQGNTSLLQSKEVYEVIYLNEDGNIRKSKAEENNCIMIDDDDDDDEEDDANNVINEALDSNTQFSFPLNNDESSNDDLELIENDNEDSALMPTSSSNSTSRRRRKKKIVNDQDLPFKCTYCSKGFKSKQAIYYHHRTHEKQNQLRCPMCPVSHCTEHLFISHVLTHESSTCFPCQVCGRALTTNEKRIEHMKSHEAERPFGCVYCFRRFRKKHFLTNHLRMHCQYLCDFCPAEFSSPQAQRRPYVCPSCETSPDIRRKVEHQRSLAAKNHTLESDHE